MSRVTEAEDDGPPTPQRLADRFVLLERRARGGMSSVYEAYDEQLDRRVAVKTLHHPVETGALERFRREATAVAALSHPGVVPIYDSGVDGDRHYLVLELVEGDDLAHLLRTDGPWEPSRAAGLAVQISDALAHAHAAGIVHRDIKPANILVERGDQARLTDFGIARLADTASVTATGMIVGTPTYCAPEQIAGEPVGPAADLYALGLVLFELLTGQLPFAGDSVTAVAAQRLTNPVPPPSASRADVPASLDAVVAIATARRPGDRYRTAADLSAALRGAARELGSGPPPTERAAALTRPVPSSTPDEPAEATTTVRRRGRAGRGWRVALALLVAGVTAGAVAGLTAGGEDPGEDAATDDQPAPQADSGPPDDVDRGPPEADARPRATGPQGAGDAEGQFRITEAIIGLEASKVAAALEENGFDVDTRSRPSGEPRGTVVAVEPSVGEQVSPGDTIVLHVADG